MDDEVFLDENDLEKVKSLELKGETSCLICFEDLSKENMVAYKVSKDSNWFLSAFCLQCIKHLISIQYPKYINTLSTTNCAKEQRALLDRGPPVNVSDRLGFPECGSKEVYYLFDFGSSEFLSPRLEGSLTGKERLDLWEELNKFRFKNDHEE